MHFSSPAKAGRLRTSFSISAIFGIITWVKCFVLLPLAVISCLALCARDVLQVGGETANQEKRPWLIE